MLETYTIELTKGIDMQYALSKDVDFPRCHAIGKEAFKMITDKLTKPDGSIEFNQLMAACAVVAMNLGGTLDFNQEPSENPNDWFSIAFPEFCSLIGPESGFARAKMERGKSIYNGDQPVEVRQ